MLANARPAEVGGANRAVRLLDGGGGGGARRGHAEDDGRRADIGEVGHRREVRLHVDAELVAAVLVDVPVELHGLLRVAVGAHLRPELGAGARRVVLDAARVRREDGERQPLEVAARRVAAADPARGIQWEDEGAVAAQLLEFWLAERECALARAKFEVVAAGAGRAVLAV